MTSQAEVRRGSLADLPLLQRHRFQHTWTYLSRLARPLIHSGCSAQFTACPVSVPMTETGHTPMRG